MRTLNSAIVDSANQAIIATDSYGLVLAWNPAAKEMFEYSAEEAIGKDFVKLIVSPAMQSEITIQLSKMSASGQLRSFECASVTKKGTVKNIWLELGRLPSMDGNAPGLSLFCRDISRQNFNTEMAFLSDERIRLITDVIDDVIWITTPNFSKFIYISPAYERIWEKSRESVYYKPSSYFDKIHPEDKARVMEFFQHPRIEERSTAEYRLIKQSGEIRWMREKRFPVYTQGRLKAIAAIVTDITDRKRLETELERQANTDFLTGVANRRAFFERATEAIHFAHRYKHPLSMLLLDIDHFKAINDLHGHPAGDHVLQSVAMASHQELRDVDVMARIGGEEFAILLPETDLDHALWVGERLKEVIAGLEIREGNQVIKVTISIGIVTVSENETTINSLLAQADKALYRAKELGRNRIFCY